MSFKYKGCACGKKEREKIPYCVKYKSLLGKGCENCPVYKDQKNP